MSTHNVRAASSAFDTGSGRWPAARPLLLLNLVAVLLVARFLNPHLGEWGGDNVRFLLLGESLASGRGYVDLHLPDAPFDILYPPVFPALLAPLIASGASLIALKGIVAAMSVAGLNAAYLFFVPLYGRRTALLIALATACCGAFLDVGLSIMSEGPFLLISMSALVAARRSFCTPARRPGLLLGAGLLVGVAILTRVIGITMIPAIGAFALAGRPLTYNRRERITRLLIVGITACAVAGSWIVVVSSQERPGRRSYLWELLHTPTVKERREAKQESKAATTSLAERPINNLWDYTTRLVQTPLPQEFQAISPGVRQLAAVTFALICGLATALVLLGLGRGVLYRRELQDYYLPFYGAVLLMWIGGGYRLFVPILPFLFAAAYDGVASARRYFDRRRGAPTLTAERAASAGNNALTLLVMVNLAITFFFPQIHERLEGRYNPWWGNYLQVVCGLAARSEPGDTILATPDNVPYYLAGIQAARLQRRDKPEQMLQSILDSGARFLITSPIQKLAYDRTIVDTLAAYPERFRTLGRIGSVQAYEISREGISAASSVTAQAAPAIPSSGATPDRCANLLSP